MRKIAVILLAGLLSFTQAATLDGRGFMKVKHGLVQAEAQTETEQPTTATCTFISNDNILRRDERTLAPTSLVPLENIAGTIRFREEDENDDYLQVRVSLTGFEPLKLYSIVINENSDVKDRCTKVGRVFNPSNSDPPTGVIAVIKSSNEGNIYSTLSEFPLKLSGAKRQSILNRSCTIHKIQSGDSYKDIWGENSLLDCAPIVSRRNNS